MSVVLAAAANECCRRGIVCVTTPSSSCDAGMMRFMHRQQRQQWLITEFFGAASYTHCVTDSGYPRTSEAGLLNMLSMPTPHSQSRC
jgi:hypothetical protein